MLQKVVQAVGGGGNGVNSEISLLFHADIARSATKTIAEDGYYAVLLTQAYDDTRTNTFSVKINNVEISDTDKIFVSNSHNKAVIGKCGKLNSGDVLTVTDTASNFNLAWLVFSANEITMPS